MVLETFAVTGGTPNARRVGNVISVPDPTTVLMVPAASPARPMAMASSGDTPRRYEAGGVGGAGGGGGSSVPAAGAGGSGSETPGFAASAASAIAACTAWLALLTSASARAPLPASFAGS